MCQGLISTGTAAAPATDVPQLPSVLRILSTASLSQAIQSLLLSAFRSPEATDHFKVWRPVATDRSIGQIFSRRWPSLRPNSERPLVLCVKRKAVYSFIRRERGSVGKAIYNRTVSSGWGGAPLPPSGEICSGTNPTEG
ncbi:hypothetical protein AAFF_G00167410 [Aldrovandia affinis]|uniref:Uncharacterized protein n=1 Tax=Aldrovandia affinis TaxID=143900 RepID=A0AAD7RMD6_9TELE|nr:hypothetical protein AAFF_G00167410 [Aldrovandia affinis]